MQRSKHRVASSKIFVLHRSEDLRLEAQNRPGFLILPRVGGALSNWSAWRNTALFLCSLALMMWTVPLWAQEPSTTGAIHGTITDEDGNPVAGARVDARSRATLTSGVTRSQKDGSYTTEQFPPGEYVVRVEARDMRIASAVVNVQAGATATADFHLQGINPEPPRVESKVDPAVINSLPVNGRATLDAARNEPGVQVVDGAALDAGKSGYLTLSNNNLTGRTTHYDFDEVEVMDETRGAATLNLPAEAVRELIVNRNLPEIFQSLNANGSVRMTTRSGENNWHGNLFGNYRDKRAGLAGFPSFAPNYDRQQYGFGAGGALIKDKAFLFLAGERSKQDGRLPTYMGFPFNGFTTRDAYFRENMLSGRIDYNVSENAKAFYRYSYDNSNEIAPTDGFASPRNQINVPSHVFGFDWNHGRFAHSGRFGYEKMVDAINPDPATAFLLPPSFHVQLGSFEAGPSNLGPRQTIQRDIFGRYDGSTAYRDAHTLRFGATIHRITQGDFYSPGNFGPSVTSSNGLDVINLINSDPNSLPPIFLNDPRGPADNPLNYPVGTLTIYNGLGNFSENSVFGHPNGGRFDTRIEAYIADTFKVFPNLNVSIGVNYVRDSGRTNSDLPGVPILSQFGQVASGTNVPQPNWNFAPQVGVAWDPGRNGRTVVRAGGGMFYDNFLLQNSYQDRMSRLANGQYSRSLTLCPNGSVLFPDGSTVSTTPGGLDIATQVCGQPLGNVAGQIDALQQAFQSAQAAVSPDAPNMYSLDRTGANFGGMLAPTYRTPRVVHINVGIEHQFGEHTVFSADYIRDIGTQYPLGIDTNHVGDATHLDSAAALQAVNATVTAVGCPAATSLGSSSQTAVNCYLNAVASPSIVDFARNGLDSSNAYCGPFPCPVVKTAPPPGSNLPPNAAAFSGFNPQVGSNVMYFPTGRSRYDGVQLAFKTSSGANPLPDVRRFDLAVSYTFSKYRSNAAMADGSGGDYSLLSVAEDYNSPHTNHWGPSGLDRRQFITFAPSFDLPHGLRFSMIGQFASPLPLSVRIPQLNGGGVAGEIFRSDSTGDGTVGDLLPASGIGGSPGARTASDLHNAIKFYNSLFAGAPTPAGIALATPTQFAGALMTPQQVVALGAVFPFIQDLPANAAEQTWLKTLDLRLSWPLHIGERVHIEPTASIFNVFNFANFGAPGHQLSGILDGSPGSSLNYASNNGSCNSNVALCSARLDRIVAGSGVYSLGAPRQFEFGVKITF